MCKSPLHDFLVALPKCEHHLHIEGSASPELIFRLAAKNNVTLPSPTADPAFGSVSALYARYGSFTSLDDFLNYYYIGFSVLLHPSDFEELAFEYFSRAASAGNVRHAEISFDPQAHTSRGVPYASVVAGLVSGQRKAEAAFPGLSTRLIVCFLRHLPLADARAALAAAAGAGHFADGTIAGMGLDSSEVPYPPHMWAGLYADGVAAGVPRFTAHAGEEGHAGYVAQALDLVPEATGRPLRRIDHGIRAADDDAVLDLLAAKGAMLTVCPISNVALRAVDPELGVAAVPIRKLLDKGVRFSINSDDPAYFGGYIQENYCAVEDVFGLSVDEWKGIVDVSIDGSWCDDERKAVLRGELDLVVKTWQAKLAT